MLGMSLVRLQFCKGTAVPSDSSRKFLKLQKKGLQEIIRKNKFHCKSVYACRQKHVLNGRF
jgi:hypothetical protein